MLPSARLSPTAIAATLDFKSMVFLLVVVIVTHQATGDRPQVDAPDLIGPKCGAALNKGQHVGNLVVSQSQTSV
jgi:hypothetical protein